jgi:hypothetical protein
MFIVPNPCTRSTCANDMPKIKSSCFIHFPSRKATVCFTLGGLRACGVVDPLGLHEAVKGGGSPTVSSDLQHTSTDHPPGCPPGSLTHFQYRTRGKFTYIPLAVSSYKIVCIHFPFPGFERRELNMVGSNLESAAISRLASCNII